MARKWFEVIGGEGTVHAVTGIALRKGEKHFLEEKEAGKEIFRPCAAPKKEKQGGIEGGTESTLRPGKEG